METLTYTQHGYQVHEHRLQVPLEHQKDGEMIELFAREIVPANTKNPSDLPALLFLQGGPGGAGPRVPDFGDGWIGAALKTHRVVLMDQRGTGRSTPLFAANISGTPRQQADYLALFLQEQIIFDAEVLREALGVDRWMTLGQSYGGFLTLAYLSMFPDSVSHSLVTGGLPGLCPIDDIYNLTYPLTAARNQTYFDRYPADEAMVRRIAAHLADFDERLPTGERLSAQRFRTIGGALGMQGGFDMLHYLLEDPFLSIAGEARLSPKFLAEVGQRVSLASNPLYFVLQEAIYGPTSPDGTRWAAERLAENHAGFAMSDPQDMSEPWYLTGEHVFRCLFEEDPALAPLLAATDFLAAQTTWPKVYDLDVLAENQVPVAAAVYYDDMFVPRELSMQTAKTVSDVRTWVTSEYQHDGVRAGGTGVFDHLVKLVRD